MKVDFKRRQIVVFLIFSIIFFDQASKLFAEKLGLLSGCNAGIAFGIGQLSPAISALVIAIVLFLLIKEKDYVLKLGFSLILAGGISNFIDRVFVLCVRDFISIFNLPSFNLADCAINLGVIVFLYSLVKNRLAD